VVPGKANVRWKLRLHDAKAYGLLVVPGKANVRSKLKLHEAKAYGVLSE